VVRTAILSVSAPGSVLARKLKRWYGCDADLYLDRGHAEGLSETFVYDLPLKPVIANLFQSYDALVLFIPLGAVVRLISSCLDSKLSDPAVICVDDSGRFAISVISGHVGGADDICVTVANVLGSVPVITSASYVLDTLALDLIGRPYGWVVDSDPGDLTRASAKVINGGTIGVFQDAGELYWLDETRGKGCAVQVFSTMSELFGSSVDVALIVTDREFDVRDFNRMSSDKIAVLYHPASLVVGMGCRRGVPEAELNKLLIDTFHECGLSTQSISGFATADLKKDEPGLIALGAKYRVSVVSYSKDQLNSMYVSSEGGRTSELQLMKSEKAFSLLGIWGVSEPAALMASGASELVVGKTKASRATIAIARKTYAV
jgi:cobalt-precorrin 5A hydrolase